MKNRSLSLTLVLSIALSGATPALNAMQTMRKGIVGKTPAQKIVILLPYHTKFTEEQVGQMFGKKQLDLTPEQLENEIEFYENKLKDLIAQTTMPQIEEAMRQAGWGPNDIEASHFILSTISPQQITPYGYKIGGDPYID